MAAGAPSPPSNGDDGASVRAYGWLLGAAVVLAAAPVARVFWLAAGLDERWLDLGATAAVAAAAVATGRGDWIARFATPALVYALGGWPWLLILVALRRAEAAWARRITRAVEWLPRRTVALMRSGPSAETRPAPPPWRRRALYALLAASLGLHALAFARARTRQVVGVDGEWYLQAADTILRTGSYVAPHPLISDGRPLLSRATRMPGYPLFLAACTLSAGPARVPLASALQCLAAAVAVLLLFLISEMLLSTPAGLAAGSLALIYFPLLDGAPLILTEALAGPLYALTVFLMLRACDKGSWPLWALAGATLGMATLVRPNTIATPLFVAAWWGWIAIRRRLGQPARQEEKAPGACHPSGWHMLALAGAFALTMAPWWVRNALVLHAFVPTATIGGVTAWAGNYPRFHGSYRAYSYAVATRVLRRHGGDEVRADAEMRRMALEQVWANLQRPGVAVGLLRDKVVKLAAAPASPDGLGGRVHLLLLFLAAAGAFHLRRSPLSGLLAAFVASVVFLHLATYAGEPRYLLPVMPLISAWAGVAVVALVGHSDD